MTLDSIQLATFAAVVTTGSFETAARSMQVTPSSVSQRIKALENTIGQVLVQRTKPCHATEAGQRILRFARQLSLLEREVLHEAFNAVPGSTGDDRSTRMTIAVHAESLATWFLPALVGLSGESMNGDLPTLLFDLRKDEGDGADRLRDGSVMAAVTARETAVQGCRSEPLGSMRYLAVSTPDFLTRHLTAGSMRDPAVAAEALSRAPTIARDHADDLQHRFIGTILGMPARMPMHYVPSTGAFNTAVGLGLGWAMIPELIARREIDEGRYVEPFPDTCLDIPLHLHHWRLDSRVLASLTTSVKRAASAILRPPERPGSRRAKLG